MINDIHHDILNQRKLYMQGVLEKETPISPIKLSATVRDALEKYKDDLSQENLNALVIAISAFWEGYECGYLRG